MSRSKLPIVVVLVCSFLLSAVTRSLTLGQRVAHDQANGIPASGAANLGRLNSFALGLVLGGLRGPLVIVLWTDTESQKSDRDLKGFDSKVDLIRQLQPEFVSVHLFQIWNKAFNISVLMANASNKYTTILDALDYAFSVDRERPDDINIIAAIGGLYFDKYGNAAEKEYYRQRLRDETAPQQDHERVTFPTDKKTDVLRLARLAGADPLSLLPREVPSDAKALSVTVETSVVDPIRRQLTDLGATFKILPAAPASTGTTAVRAGAHVTVLDSRFDVLPQFVSPRFAPATPGAYDGSPLFYVKRFEPYPYGVSPYAMAYGYYKRAQWLQETYGRRHAQMAPRVISSRPALALEKWINEEHYRARRAEAEVFGLPVSKDENAADLTAAQVTFANPPAPSALLNEAIYSYDRAAQLALAMDNEFDHHLLTFDSDLLQYTSHQLEGKITADLMKADRDFLKATQVTGPERATLARAALDAYERAADDYTRLLMRYYVSDESLKAVLPTGFDRRPASLAALSRPQLIAAYRGLGARAAVRDSDDANNEEIGSYGALITRARLRADTLRPVAAPAPAAPAVTPAAPVAPPVIAPDTVPAP